MTKFKKILTGMNLVDAAYGDCTLVAEHDALYLYCPEQDPFLLHRRMAELDWNWDPILLGWKIYV